jgi:thioredoxin reductase
MLVDMTDDQTYDVVVIGGGAAGLGGAMALGRSRRSVLVIDAGEPRNSPADHHHVVHLSRVLAHEDEHAGGSPY